MPFSPISSNVGFPGLRRGLDDRHRACGSGLEAADSAARRGVLPCAVERRDAGDGPHLDRDLCKLGQELCDITARKKPARIVLSHQGLVRRRSGARLQRDRRLRPRRIEVMECASRSRPRLLHFLEDAGPLGNKGKPKEGLIAPGKAQHAGDLGQAERHKPCRVILEAVIECIDRCRGLGPAGKLARQGFLPQHSCLHEDVVVPQQADRPGHAQSEQDRKGGAGADATFEPAA